jgi:hypothetical protein
LLDDKRLEISKKMQRKSRAARNAASNDYKWAVAELDVVNEWAQKLAAAWIEIWDIQGFPRSHALYRAIYDYELVTLFATRNGCFKGELQHRALVKRRPADSATGGWFYREIGKLASKWNRRMNVDSRKNMYAAKQAKQATVTVDDVPPAISKLSRANELQSKKRSGRPRKDDLAREAAQLKLKGRSYAQIATCLNANHPGEDANKESVRALLRSRKTSLPLEGRRS